MSRAVAAALLLGLGLLGLGLFACDWVGTRGATLKHRLDGRDVEVLAGGKPFATVHLDGGRIPFVWPLVGPGGLVMTRAFPMGERPGEATDHPHHQSLWFAHGDVNGHDFWHDPDCKITAVGEPRVTGDGSRDRLTVEMDLVWSAPGAPEVLRETRTYSFSDSVHRRTIEVELSLEATQGEVVFGDTKEGTFALRVRPELRLRGEVAAGSIFNSEGLEGDRCWGQRARWVAYAAPVEGQSVAVGLMDHPSNLRHPTRFHARDYGLLAANPFGEHGFGVGEKRAGDYLLGEGERLTLRYLVTLEFHGKDRVALPSDFEAAWADWTE